MRSYARLACLAAVAFVLSAARRHNKNANDNEVDNPFADQVDTQPVDVYD